MAIIGFFKSASNTDQIPEKKTDPEGTEQQDKDYAAQEMPSTYGEYGAHNVLVGHHVSYAAGDHQGKGKVVATGEHGCTVSDSTGREHRVFWHEVSGHHGGGEKEATSVEKQTKTSEHESEKMNKALGGAAMLKGFVFENEAGQVIGVGGADQFLKAHVKGYTRTDGVFVKEHDDKRQAASSKVSQRPSPRNIAQSPAPNLTQSINRWISAVASEQRPSDKLWEDFYSASERDRFNAIEQANKKAGSSVMGNVATNYQSRIHHVLNGFKSRSVNGHDPSDIQWHAFYSLPIEQQKEVINQINEKAHATVYPMSVVSDDSSLNSTKKG